MRINLREPRTQRVLLACMAIAGAGYYYFVSDALSFSYRARSRAIAEKREVRDKLALEVKKARASATRLTELRRESEQLEARWHRVEARLPTDLDPKELMSEITTLGTRQSLQFLLLEPQGERALDFCTEVPFSVRVLGHYHQLGRFLAELDNMPRILKLEGLRIVQNPKAKEDKEAPPIIAELEVSTFTLGGGLGGGIPSPLEGADAVGAAAGGESGGTPAPGAGAVPAVAGVTAPAAPGATATAGASATAGAKAKAGATATAAAAKAATPRANAGPAGDTNREPRVEGGAS